MKKTLNQLEEALRSTHQYFIQFNGEADVTDGFKLSIQGRTIKDALYLFEHLYDLMNSTHASYKIGTQRLINCENEEQTTKLFTIYVPNGVDVVSFAELVFLNIKKYSGGNGIKAKRSYTHYKNSIYYRNDRDENGEYINA